MDESSVKRIAKSNVDDQFKICNDRFITDKQLDAKMKSIWEFAKSRAHKGLVGLVLLFLGALLLLLLVAAVPCLAVPYRVFIHISRSPADTTEAAVQDYEARIEKAQSLHQLAGAIRISSRAGLSLGSVQADTADVPLLRAKAYLSDKALKVQCERMGLEAVAIEKK